MFRMTFFHRAITGKCVVTGNNNLICARSFNRNLNEKHQKGEVLTLHTSITETQLSGRIDGFAIFPVKSLNQPCRLFVILCIVHF